MRCSKCNEIIKPIVAVDIDGTLADYHGHFLRFAQAYFDMPTAGEDLDGFQYYGDNSFKEWWMHETGLGIKDWHDVKLAYRQGGMKRTMPIFPGAQALCWSIRDAGAELWVTTTRPYLSLDNIVPDTVEWLRRHDIFYDGMLFDEDKYEQLAARVDTRRVVAVLDDLPEMLNSAAAVLENHVPILIRNGYNARVRTVLSADLDGATDIVIDRVRNWIDDMSWEAEAGHAR